MSIRVTRGATVTSANLGAGIRDYGIVTSLPTSPTPATGDTCTYTDSLSSPTYYWQLQYNGSEAGSLKWAVIGGSPIRAEVATDESTSSSTYAALATAGPSVTVPLAGDYEITHGAHMYVATAAGFTLMSYDIGGTGAVDADAIQTFHQTDDIGTSKGYFMRTKRQTGLAASTALVSKYLRSSTAVAHFFNRRIAAMPMRVG